LRQRGDDLPMLVRHYLARLGRELGRDVVQVSPTAMDRLRDYSWPGNIRELQNVLRQALLRARGRVLLPEFLPELELDAAGSAGVAPSRQRGDALEAFVRLRLSAGVGGVYEETHRWVDRLLLSLALEHTGGNQRQAAEILGIARKTLRDRLRDANITVHRSIEPGEGGAT
jgi:DNA-binding NtrC family response regulator